MLFQGDTLTVSVDNQHIAILAFDAKGGSVNKFDTNTLQELNSAIGVLLSEEIDGLILKSNKEAFIVGADITQFGELFAGPEEEIYNNLIQVNAIFNQLEDLPFPTVSVIEGLALGGGLEVALATDFRLLTPEAKVGLPEVKLGIYPGFGGTVRLPRIIGLDNAIEWIATGKEHKAHDALDVGLVAGITDKENIDKAARRLIELANANQLSINAIRDEKKTPVKVNDFERIMCFTTAKGLVGQQAGPHMPAPITSVKSIEKSCPLDRDDALKIEAKYFARLAKTDVSGNLIALFLNEQDLTKRNKSLSDSSKDIEHMAVLGAGIMGGGIAYQAASKSKHVIMKDVAQQGLDQGMAEATQLLNKRVSRGRMSAEAMATTLTRITPQLDYAHVDKTEIVVEAVVEKLSIKQQVLGEVEGLLNSDAILASNTSTLSITEMAKSLKRPENFCGMHFFNPVHRMPLVEVIRGEKTAESTIAATVRLALDMGKTPIVVNDCPGFYVNRVLFPYLNSFNLLVQEGADFVAVDKVMEKFGWPMGPAYLIDVVGIDTGVHAANVMAEGFSDRMDKPEGSAMQALYDHNYYGQKNHQGFYKYALDKKGKPKKLFDAAVLDIIKPAVKGQATFDEETIIDRLMIPMCFEVIRCLEEKIVADPVDADMGLLMGIGFPLFRGGPFRYMQSVGLKTLVEKSKAYAHLGKAYEAPDMLVSMVNNNESFYA
ncbi:MAG: fatty acid oxidation complex subunit alpha FadB [Cellvibrionales bacterium]|nr:fatty acid oxidation complex subunit alpha FadB [Cellvibrionales bacterium]